LIGFASVGSILGGCSGDRSAMATVNWRGV